ncbi:MAG: Flp pilus assembly protein TadD, partial [Candidatus Azotimanducaceae bacterium]
MVNRLKLLALLVSLVLLPNNLAFAAQIQGEAALAEEARALIDAGSYDAALKLLQANTLQFENNPQLLGLQATVQYQLNNFGEAALLLQRSLAINENPRLEVLLAKVRQRFEKFTVNKNMAVVVLQKETDAGNYATAIAVARLALQKFPDDELLYTAYGRALLEALQLDEAELALRTALQLNPKNVEA